MNRKKASGTSESAQRKPPASTIDAARNVPRRRDSGPGQHQRQERAQDHAAVDQHVRHRDDRSAAVGRRPPLQERIERNKQQPAEDPQQRHHARSCRKGRGRSRRRPARSRSDRAHPRGAGHIPPSTPTACPPAGNRRRRRSPARPAGIRSATRSAPGASRRKPGSAGGTSVAIVHTNTWPISASRSTRSALIDSHASRTVVPSPPSARAALTGGNRQRRQQAAAPREQPGSSPPATGGRGHSRE